MNTGLVIAKVIMETNEIRHQYSRKTWNKVSDLKRNVYARRNKEYNEFKCKTCILLALLQLHIPMNKYMFSSVMTFDATCCLHIILLL